jgi:Xaa-Pro aminopeptidase
MPETHVVRRDRLRVRTAAAGAEAALITGQVNVRYLTGYTGPHAALLLLGSGVVLAVPADGVEQAREQAPEVEVVEGSALELAWRAGDTVAVEEQNLTVEYYRALEAAAPGARFTALGHAVEDLRRIKDDGEIANLRIACEIADQALGEMVESILVGRTERHIAMELERRMADHGSEGPAFRTAVASGPHTALPRHRPGDRRVEDGDFLQIEFGATYRGYRSDTTRTFVIGTAPADWQVELYDVVFAAQKAGRQALAPGVATAAVDAAARAVVDRAGYGGHFPHGTGHGVGLAAREDPYMDRDSGGKLDACMPVTVEPGVYLPGRGGVRIEDTLVVRPSADGGPELLTITTKELLVL